MVMGEQLGQLYTLGGDFVVYDYIPIKKKT